MRFFVVIFLVVTQFHKGTAQHFTPTAEYEKAYALLLNLEFEKAQKQIAAIRLKDDRNLSAVYLEDLSDFLYIVVTENQQAFNARKEQMSQRLNLLNGLPDSSPYKLMALGEVHLHWAFSMMRFEEYLGGARAINKAFNHLEQNKKRFPNFIATNKGLGLLHTLIGTVPDNYKWATKLMGVEGTIELGINEMESVVRSSTTPETVNLKKETLFLLTFLHINLINDQTALNSYLKEVKDENGPLMDFAEASLLKEIGKTNAAIALLNENRESMRAFPYLNFLLGEMKLARMDPDADQFFKAFISSFSGKSYKKSAYQKLAWHALIIRSDADLYRSMISKVELVGNSTLDEDRAAQTEFESQSAPNVVLLKTRIQFDGGFYNEALRTLIASDSKSFKTADERLEFSYRLARIHHELGNHQQAIDYYKLTIDQGQNSKRYFAANSSLMLGLIYEHQGLVNEARRCFTACSGFENSEYRNSINQKAKAGILRLKN
ncbi:MAG: hypothetical protein RL266_305 [Bacteroidota bacterium]